MKPFPLPPFFSRARGAAVSAAGAETPPPQSAVSTSCETSKIIRPACKCIEKRRPYTPMAER